MEQNCRTCNRVRYGILGLLLFTMLKLTKGFLAEGQVSLLTSGAKCRGVVQWWDQGKDYYICAEDQKWNNREAEAVCESLFPSPRDFTCVSRIFELPITGGTPLSRDITIRNITDHICIPGRPYEYCFGLYTKNDQGYINPCIEKLSTLLLDQTIVLSLAAVDCVMKTNPTEEIYDIRLQPQHGAFCNGDINILDPTTLPYNTLFHVSGPERLAYSRVCGTGWSDANAQVICQHLKIQVPCRATVRYRPPDQMFLPYQTWRCEGGEDVSNSCHLLRYTPKTCHPNNKLIPIASVTCTDLGVRLKHGECECSGRIEVQDRGGWSGLCLDAVDDNVAQVICNQLGLNYATCMIINAGVFDSGFLSPRLSHYSQIRCNGDEQLLEQCEIQETGLPPCFDPYTEAAGVSCNCYIPEEDSDQTDIQQKGPKGSTGQKGGKGLKGFNGNKGIKGRKGVRGTPGLDSIKGLECSKGEPGPKGEVGDPGVKGMEGLKGVKGFKGYAGVNGDMGDKGDVGDIIQGSKGTKGIHGFKGAMGEKGEVGLKGNRGYMGEDGKPGVDMSNEKGNKGEKGIRGLEGDPGERGPKGLLGEKGIKGDMGEMGDIGIKGEKGTIGMDGIQGEVGNPGVPGLNGQKGEKGDVGKKGEKGLRGLDGEIGLKGDPGESGEKGVKGEKGRSIKGRKGEAGANPPGEKGVKGEKGERGVKGTYGNRGIKGSKGSTGPPGQGLSHIMMKQVNDLSRLCLDESLLEGSMEEEQVLKHPALLRCEDYIICHHGYGRIGSCPSGFQLDPLTRLCTMVCNGKKLLLVLLLVLVIVIISFAGLGIYIYTVHKRF